MPESDYAQPMNCQELVELVSDYLEGTLSIAERARFDAHIARCTGCTNYLSQMRRTLETVGSLSEADISPTAEHELLEVFRNWKRDRQFR